MYKIVIVDDEFKARQLLEMYLQPYADFEIAASLEDGTEAVEYLTRHDDVDVVISDIRMRKMSGVELAKYIHETMPRIRVVLLSAYALFEYAREALRYNVFHYLLKVVDPRELEEVMGCLKKLLDQEKDQRAEEELQVERECFFADLFRGRFADISQCKDAFAAAQLGMSFKNAYCCLAEISFMPVRETLDLQARCGKDKFVRSLCGVIQCARRNIQCILLHAADSAYHVLLLSPEGGIMPETLAEPLESIFRLKTAVSVLAEGTPEFIFANSGAYAAFADTLFPSAGTEQLRDNAADAGGDAVRIAKQYIEAHYAEDISREDIARLVFLNSSYFGRMFKKATGTTFTDYLIEVRLKNAVALLDRGEKVSAVYQMVGYKDEKYFRKVFREYMGCSPAEYSREAAEKNDD